jgi:hypothetical protein
LITVNSRAGKKVHSDIAGKTERETDETAPKYACTPSLETGKVFSSLGVGACLYRAFCSSFL